MNHLVSVIIPAYNSGDYIGRAIQSVLNQRYTPYEVIVVDDGSTDNTRDLARSYPIVCLNKPNGGAASARNVGIRAAKGDWIAFLDSDDCWLPNHLEILISIIKEHSLKWACGSLRRIRNGETIAPRWLDPEKYLIKGAYFENFFQAWGRDLVGNTDGMLIKKEILGSIGLFEESFPVGEDLDLWFRIAHQNPRIGFCSEPTAEYYMRHGSLMDVHGQSALIFLNLLRKHFDLAKTYGKEHLVRFMPAARKLAKWTLEQGVKAQDSEVVHCLVNEYSRTLQWRIPVAFSVAYIPGAIMAYDHYLRTGVRIKSLFRR